MKRAFVLSMTFLILAIFALTVSVSAAQFPDVPSSHDNYEAVMHLTGLGVIAGYEDGTFCPEREITRTEFCALMARTLGYSKDTYVVKRIPFTDVSEEYWGLAYISFCYERGLINGMGEGLFAPADKVTVAQAAKMAVCAVGMESDALNIMGEKWYSGYMEVAEDNGLLELVDQEPGENAKRANVAQIVYNMVMTGLVEIEEPPTELPDENEGSNDFEPVEEEEKQPEDTSDENTDRENSQDSEEEALSELEKAYKEKDFSDVKVILVDAGHNYDGKDTGARVDELEAREEIVTWLVADKLRTKLEDMGYTVVMTRDKMTDSIENTSTTASLQARVDLAHKSLADLYISIHCNMGGGTGTETYCFSMGGYSARLAALAQDKITEATGFYDRGVKNANFYVIKNTLMPAILIETGFLDSAKDREILLTDEGQEKIAEAIADAVWEYDMMEPLKIEAQEEKTDDEEA